MSIHYLLDGYNIIHQMPTSKQDKLEDQRDRLIRFIERRSPQGSRRNKITVVFDGSMDAFGRMRSSVVNVIFSQGESADERIRGMVAGSDNAKDLIVVTDDRDIQYAVKALGARIISVKEFLNSGKTETGNRKDSQGSAEAPEKYISKTEEARINNEMVKIWLKSRKKDRQ